MAGRGETLKMFVVQRTFRTVRRGYDPDEVDRHLELVSRWFTQTDAAKALREERERIQERERAAAEREARAERSLEGVRMEAEATIEGAHRRAAAEERDRKSTRLNSSHQIISYAVFCLKKKKKPHQKQLDAFSEIHQRGQAQA